MLFSHGFRIDDRYLWFILMVQSPAINLFEKSILGEKFHECVVSCTSLHIERGVDGDAAKNQQLLFGEKLILDAREEKFD